MAMWPVSGLHIFIAVKCVYKEIFEAESAITRVTNNKKIPLN